MFGDGIEIADRAMSFTMDHYWSHPETVTFLNDEIPQGGKYIPKKLKTLSFAALDLVFGI